MTRPHLLDVLRDKVLLADGAMGTRVQALTLDVEKDYWGNENCTDILVLSRPDLVREIHRGYYEAGADMVETNTFGGSPVTLGEFGLSDRAYEVNKRGAELAREAAESFRRWAGPLGAGQLGPGHEAANFRQHRLRPFRSSASGTVPWADRGRRRCNHD